VELGVELDIELDVEHRANVELDMGLDKLGIISLLECA
jgi:hypothetical protein